MKQETDPSTEEAKVVEIRIHGIGGEPAGQLLDDPHPRLTAGDDISGFHQPTEKYEFEMAERQREGLCWGGNTSGSWKNALWVLLLPFALVNVAGYMHRPGEQPSKVMRWLALTVTLGAVLLSAATAYDLLAIQCGAVRDCVGRVRFLAPYDWKWGTHHVFYDFPTRRLGVATMLPLGLLSLLWFAGRYAYKDLEKYLYERLGSAGGSAPLADRSFWNGYEPSFRARLIHLSAGRAFVAGILTWSILTLEPDAPLLPEILLGVASGVVLLLTFAAIVLPSVHRSEENNSLYTRLGLLQIASWGVLGAALGRSAAVTFPNRDSALLKWLVILLAASSLARVLFPRRFSDLVLNPLHFLGGLLIGLVFFPVHKGTEPLLGAQDSFYAGLFGAPYDFAWALAAVQAGLILGLACKPLQPPYRRDRGIPFGPHWKENDLSHPAFNGRGSAVLSTLAIFLMLAVAAGVHRGIANLIADPVHSNQGPVRLSSEAGAGVGERASEQQALSRPVIPWWYETTAHILVVLLISLGVVGSRFKRALKRGATEAALAEAARHLKSDPCIPNEIHLDREDDRERLKRVVRNWALPRQLVGVDLKVSRVTWRTALLGGALLLIQLPDSLPFFGDRTDFRPDGWGGPLGPFATFSLWVVGLLPVAAVLIIRGSAQSEYWRKQIGRVWDVLMFWPRSIQPFAPPCYSERVVPQLRLHIDRLQDQGKHVVIAGHSQGSVIAASAIAIGRLPEPGAADQGFLPGHPSRLDLVVFGSPLSILYERAYPAYFSEDFFQVVKDQTVRWHHFFARTDLFALPFWKGTPADVNQTCPVCAFSVKPASPGTAPATETDYVLVDPILWDWPTGEPPRPVIKGHSTYATGEHRRFEEHMRKITEKACDAFAHPASAGRNSRLANGRKSHSTPPAR